MRLRIFALISHERCQASVIRMIRMAVRAKNREHHNLDDANRTGQETTSLLANYNGYHQILSSLSS